MLRIIFFIQLDVAIYSLYMSCVRKRKFNWISKKISWITIILSIYILFEEMHHTRRTCDTAYDKLGGRAWPKLLSHSANLNYNKNAVTQSYKLGLEYL